MQKWYKSDIALFLYKVVGIYILWYLIYDLWLLPNGQLDRWLVHNIVDVAAGIFHRFNYDVYAVGRMMGAEGTPGIVLINGCSGISAIGLFIGFVIAYPGRWIPRFFFIMIGIGVIYLTNIARIIVLVLTQKNWPGMFHITHDYSSTAIFYLIIFAMWMIWVNLGDQNIASNQSGKTETTA